MNAEELRRAFTGFFAERGHTEVPSASLVPQDPSVLFTVAGMVPFKPYFLGDERPPFPRATSVQRCVRAGGKQNDLDEVGHTDRHLSFFEMLGNFSFGDYFKELAIPLAWELVTEVLGIEADRLWVTVHLDDDQAEEIWRDSVGFPAERIQRLGEDNFWRMGDTGPCGPCSEIHLDRGPAHGNGGGPAAGGGDRYLEIWNLVFMQFNQRPDGSREALPRPSVDTGAGLERILAVLQGAPTIYETDALAPLVEAAQAVTGTKLGAGRRSDASLRILAEHARTMTHLVSDGVFPSNEDRGYVLRRIIRRAVRHAFLLGVERPVTPDLVSATVETMGGAYPDLAANADFVTSVVAREEERFRQTLRAGSAILDGELEGAPGGMLEGPVAFRLHDTFGFPLEVTEEVAAERGVRVDVAGFEAAMAEQRARSDAGRAGAVEGGPVEAYREVVEHFGPTEFVRDRDETRSRVLAVLARHGGEVEVFLDLSPFYAEAGGQVGDTGTLTTPTGAAEVLDTTYALPGLHRHTARLTQGEIRPGQEALASIDAERRAAIRRNHTGTHLLHWALRSVLGDHVKQQGSLVAPEYLRFDFTHYQALTPAELAAVEDLANGEILTNDRVRNFETSRQEASRLGAIAFFGEKYGDVVRVLEAGPSVELCGGTHVAATGDIGPVRITSEGSIGANLRRIVATTGSETLAGARRDAEVLTRAATLLGVSPADVVTGVEKVRDELRASREELKSLRLQAAGAQAGHLAGEAVDGVVVTRRDGVGRDELRDLAVAVRDRPGVRAVVVGGAPPGGGAALVAAVAPGSGLVASELIAEAARAVRGGGGRAPDLAVAGGRDPEGLDTALELARSAAGLVRR